MPKNTENAIPPILFVLLIGVIFRLLLSRINFMYQNDIMTYQIWSSMLYEDGLSHFYTSGSFTDYPPVYMYVLFVLGMIRSLFNWDYLSPSFNLLIRLPAILCDMGLGYCIYHFFANTQENRRGRKVIRNACLLAAAYVFNPAIILDSTVWGQVDAVYTLLLFLSLLFLKQKKHLWAYLLFGTAILTKPQSLFVGPVYLYSAYAYIKDNCFSLKAFANQALAIFLSLVLMLALAFPFTQNFDFTPIFMQYYNTLDSYAYGSVNAYNFFALIGGNWQPLETRFIGIPYTIWGAVFIVSIIAASLFALFKDKRGHYMLAAAALNVLVFMFSVKMHERYLFPALAFFLAAYIEHADRRVMGLYATFSALFFANCFDVLRMLNNGNQLSIIQHTQPLFSLMNVLLTVYMVYVIISMIKRPEASKAISFLQTAPRGKSSKSRKPSKHNTVSIRSKRKQRLEDKPYNLPPKMERIDIIALLSLMLVYGFIAFYRLGDTQIPQTTWKPESNEAAIIDFGEVRQISRIQFMMGARHDKAFMLYASTDGQLWEYEKEVLEADVFAWTNIDLAIQARYFEIIPFGEGLMMQEAAFRDADGQIIRIGSTSVNAEALTDEQHLVPVSADYMNGTYFDEIYHPRTGYEFVHGLEVYENTHPPLGKNFIALSVALFGMTPFAWRLPGTLLGVLMIPLLYTLARYLLRSNKWAFFAAFIFTFDFMHFTQTRLATIDTYVTFFVIAMYLFMYLYIRSQPENFQRRSFLWLALSGIAMGLAIASKWQGVYGALGLPLLFFPVWFKQYRQDKRQAWITATACCLFFIIVPVLIYTLSYIPFVNASGGSFKTMIDNQQHMYWYHSTLEAEHDFASPWWEWPLMIKPMYLYASTVSDTLRQGISTFGNPAVWWFGIFTTGYALYTLYRKQNYDLVFLLVAYAAQFLPWILVSRSTYIYHYFPSVPFVVLLTAHFFKEHASQKRLRYAYGYAALVLLLFILFYPVLSGMPFSVYFVHTYLRWLPGWVLM